MKSLEILQSLRKEVNDFYSITPLHFLNAGPEGIDHFYFLFNTILSNINLAGIPELNNIYAIVLYKGHGKNRECCRSYRTISTCPLLAKAVDLYIRQLSQDKWNLQQAPTQYQGHGMSHELASLLLTETLQFSFNVTNRPVFALFLDAKSAFDRVVKEILTRNLFLSGMSDHSLLYLDKRLGSRKTYCEFNKTLMGPIIDVRGLEQGGISSSDEYKLYNNEQAKVSQASGLGVTMRGSTISCISLADDALLVANTLYDLRNLLYLTVQYCLKYDVELVPEKTQLIAFHRQEIEHDVNFAKESICLTLNDSDISFVNQVSHLGVLRGDKPGNTLSIMDRLAAHRRQLFSLLPAGMALKHSGNPATSIKVEKIYCLPVLMSGLASLFITHSEMVSINSYYKNVLTRLMKLYDRTPDSAIYFLAGSLPAEAYLHLRQLTLFSMISRLDDNILRDVAFHALISSRPSDKSWFLQIRLLCLKYNLPEPLTLLSTPPPPVEFKNLCKSRVHEYWHCKLSEDAMNLPSLQFMHTEFLSLSRPHPIWSTLDGNPFQTKAARVQAIFLSGRYRTEKLCSRWSHNNQGYCLLDSCNGENIVEDIFHVLLHCPALANSRSRLLDHFKTTLTEMPLLLPIFQEYFYQDDSPLKIQFLLDCSVLPMVISAHQMFGDVILIGLFKMTRTWCHSIHRARIRALGRR